MWHRTTKIRIKNYDVDVISYLDVDDDGNNQICFRGMLNEYFLTFELPCPDGDLAYSLIENFPIKTLKDKMTSLADDNGAVD